MSNKTGAISSVSIPFNEASNDIRKQERYVLCMRFIQKVIGDFRYLSAGIHDDSFTQLGHIASCVDTYIDELTIEVKHELESSFKDFFHSLQNINDPYHFQQECLNYRKDHLFLADQVCSYHELYHFYDECRSLGLLDALCAFSLDMIKTSAEKQAAENPNSLVETVKQEGNSAVDFLILYLKAKQIVELNNEQQRNLKKYFISIERVLNLADELLDSRGDQQKGIITIRLNLKYYLILGSKLSYTLLKTFINYPLTFSKHIVQFVYRAIQLELKYL